MKKIPIFEQLKKINGNLFNLTVWNNGTISILNESNNCAIATANIEEIYNLIKKEAK